MSKRVGKTVVVAFAVAVGSLATAVYAVAGHDASTPSMSGCLTKDGTLVKLAIGDAPKSACVGTQLPVHLGPGDITQVVAGTGLTGGGASGAVTLSIGCPSGSTLSTGVCIEDTERAAASHSEAEDACAEEGMRLPSPGELVAFRALDGTQISTGGNWTDDLADIATSSTFKYFVITERGNGVEDAFDDVAYRCVSGPSAG